MRLTFILAGVACASLIASAASAHPGSEILTAGAAKQRAAMTQGVSVEEVRRAPRPGRPWWREIKPSASKLQRRDLSGVHFAGCARKGFIPAKPIRRGAIGTGFTPAD